MSGCIANPTPTATNFPHDCNAATIAVTSEEPVVPRHSGASSSSKRTAAASRVLTVQGSSGNSFWKRLADYESVDSRKSIRELCANLDRETVVCTLFRCESKGKRDRYQKRCAIVKRRVKISTILKRKAEIAVRGEKMAQQKLYEAEAEVEAKYWEKGKLGHCSF